MSCHLTYFSRPLALIDPFSSFLPSLDPLTGRAPTDDGDLMTAALAPLQQAPLHVPHALLEDDNR